MVVAIVYNTKLPTSAIIKAAAAVAQCSFDLSQKFVTWTHFFVSNNADGFTKTSLYRCFSPIN